MNGYEAFFWSTMIIGGAFFAGYHYAKLKAPTKILYQQTHIFKDPVVMQKGDTVQMIFQVDEKYYSHGFKTTEDGHVSELKYNVSKELEEQRKWQNTESSG
jgi:hypothetical protein